MSKAEGSSVRERLLDAAQEVFAEHGFTGGSVAEIARRAGLTTGAIYSNFRGKSEMYVALVARNTKRRIGEAEQVRTAVPDADEGVRHAGQLFAGLIDRGGPWPLLLFEFGVQAARDPEVQEAFRAERRALRAAVADVVESIARQQGRELPVPGEQLATGIIAIGVGVAFEQLVDPDADPRSSYQDILALLIAGVAASSNGDGRPPP